MEKEQKLAEILDSLVLKEKIIKFFNGSTLYHRNGSTVHIEIDDVVSSDKKIQSLTTWLLEIGSDEWSLEPPKPKTVTFYRYTYEDEAIYGNKHHICRRQTEWTTVPFEAFGLIDEALLKTETKKVEV